MQEIVCISGTSRPGNFTSRALAVCADEINQKGARVITFDAREMSLDFPGNPPTDDAKKLQEAVQSAAGVILATPEYHGSFAAMTKLIIENMGFPSGLSKKPVALLGVAAGRIGAIKSLEQLKGICSHVGALVVPGSVSIAGVNKVFDEEGRCTDAGSEQSLRGLSQGLLDFIQEYVCPKHNLEESVRSDSAPWSTSV